MDATDLTRRLDRLGYITKTQKAAALKMSRPHVGKMVRGTRPVPAHVERTVELLEQAHPVILSGAMRYALGRAAQTGDPVPVPVGGQPRDGSSWDATYDAMHVMGLITYKGVRPHATRRGLRALDSNHGDDDG